MAEKLSKQAIIDSVAEKAGLTKKQAGAAVNAIVETISDALADGNSVALIGFGTFEVKERAAREGRNPQSGEKISIPAKKVPAFRAGKQLRESITQ